LGAPLNFGPEVSHFGPLVAYSPRAQFITSLLGNVPGTFLNAASALASPASFHLSRWLDRVKSLADADALRTHLRVERWTLDEMELPRQLFEEIVEWLYRENRFMRGTLTIHGRTASPGSVSAPVLSVLDPRSLIVPPESVLPFHHALTHVDQKIIPYPGDVGVALQHVGMLVGRRAHKFLWPEILKWLHARQ
jgi:polyhydroxyalkanoate synthase